MARVLGGVAFAPDGDVWASDCLFQDSRLHRFDKQSFRPATHGTTSLREKIDTVTTSGGCGLTNHPDGAMCDRASDGERLHARHTRVALRVTACGRRGAGPQLRLPGAVAPVCAVYGSANPPYATPTTSLITVTAQRINTAVSAQLIVVATDAFGNTVTCDPVETTVTKLRQDRGVQTFTDLPYEEHFVTIENGSPGLRGMDIIVNGTEFRVRGLDDREVRRVNVRRAMLRGHQNVITIVPRGRRGESADVTIAARE